MKLWVKLMLWTIPVYWIALYLLYQRISRSSVSGFTAAVYCVATFAVWFGIIVVFGVIIPERRMKRSEKFDISELD